MATLSEVARLAGVTTATVSNVLRNPGKVRPATVARVEAAIAQLGYRPNLMARALARGKSCMVALVLPSITNPFYPELVRVAERVARQRKYFLMVCNTDEDPEIGHAYLNQIAGTLADGVLVLHMGMATEVIEELRGRHAPIVLASEEFEDFSDGLPHVIVNFRRAGQVAAEHLLKLGHRKIGVIVGRGLEGMQHLRLEGFKHALLDAGVAFDESCVQCVLDTVPGGYQATSSLLSTHPDMTAIFATNDLLAFGASQALADRGIRIPGDISLIGITDIQLAQQMRPALTTVALHIQEIAKISINLLLDLIENPGHQPILVRAPEPELVVRASTSSLRRGHLHRG
ncbi:LacI family DNA-binding transcriptional regulator [Uliginosibacterium gangwonense]|uniref:LacI family DNA-binding transcriptional regulator n=1 Tax=Uliginosibacterium gangwonense TaxID=392736 RepID=UPI000366F638|nr:LacI family DNA-binding transcriptional regulator [Uliginosibacterium gangwonense]